MYVLAALVCGICGMIWFGSAGFNAGVKRGNKECLPVIKERDDALDRYKAEKQYNKNLRESMLLYQGSAKECNDCYREREELESRLMVEEDEDALRVKSGWKYDR